MSKGHFGPNIYKDQIKNDVANTTADIKNIENQPRVESETGKTKDIPFISRMSRSFINKSFHRSGKKANTSLNVSANNNTIYEEESPLKENRMNQTVCGAPLTSPHSKFYRTNSNPFPDTTKCASPIRDTRKKIEDSKQQKSFGGKFLRYIRPNAKKKQLPSNDGESFKQNEINSNLLPSEVPTNKLNPDASPSQIYEKSINKHGDVVEYAVPYSEQIRIDFQPPIKSQDECQSKSFIRCEDVVDENVLNESKWNDHVGDMSLVHIQRPIAKITDLDKSTDGSRSLDQSGKELMNNSNKEVLSELDSLERWSQNIPQRSLPPVDPPVNKNVPIIECTPQEIKPNLKVLKNTIALPLHFSSGFFRKTPVVLRKCCPRDSTSVGLVEEAIERDYDVLNNVKHSNIILLMAASFHRKSFDHMTLVLETADYTLNYYIHQMNMTLSIDDSISVVKQIASAALYLQECGYIHSNISSHNILVRENPWCVKLSSFELTTEVDYTDTKIEIFIKYRQLLPSLVSDSLDLPKYSTIEDGNSSLKEQYQQMSKLLPILKCSSNTQHKYLGMMSKHLIYDSNYRQHLSLHNFQAPELLTTKRQFVFPTKKADVYSLCLVLWELLNNCVPFVVYNKLDMERMIASKKLNLPFFERERCEPFLPIFRVGLAVNPNNRSIDVQKLMTMLDDVGFRNRSVLGSANKPLNDNQCETKHEQEKNLDDMHLYVNTPSKCLIKNDANKSTLACCTMPESVQTVNKSDCCVANSIVSPNTLDFNQLLNEKELTSTKKKRKKSPQTLVKRDTFRQLFKNSTEATNSDSIASEVQLSYAQLNENLDVIASDIRRGHVLDEIKEESHSDNANDSVVGPLLVKEDELPSAMFIEKPEWRKTSPEALDSKVRIDNSINSKSCNNLFDASVSPSRSKFFHSNITPSPSTGLAVGEYSLPNTPIARKNKIRRNNWLSKQQMCSSSNDIDEEMLMMENQNQASPMDDNNKRNVSIRIVHTKVTPKKVDSASNPLVMSRVKFFDSSTEGSNTGFELLSNKLSNNDRVDDIASNSLANYPTKNSSCKEITNLPSEVEDGPSHSREPSTERNGTFSNCSTLPMSKKNCTETTLRDSMSSSDHPNNDFENKLWKRELDICNRSSLGANNDEEDKSNVITPKWQSVRDKIMKFEKCVDKPSSSIAENVMKNISKTMTGTQPNSIRFSDAPTIIKRTIYRESIFSGVNLSSFDGQLPIFDQLNLAGQRLTTQVTLNMRQVRRRSSDVDLSDRSKMDLISESQHTICGSQQGLLSFNSSVLRGESSLGVTQYLCSSCASKMSPDELRSLTLEPVNDRSLPSPIEDCQQIPLRRCQARVKSQNTRSIEDLYIDDDFDQGLGANMELQSDCSDFLNFDITSTEFFNKSDVAT